MANVTSIADWRKKNEVVQRDQPTVPLLLPSGVTIEACRPPLDEWIASGRLPDSLVRTYLAAHPGPETEHAPAVEEVDQATALESITAMRRLVCATVVNPRVAENPETEDVMALADMPTKDFFFIYQWALGGSPSLPVKTEEGEVSAEALANFRDKAGGRSTADAGVHSARVRPKSGKRLSKAR